MQQTCTTADHGNIQISMNFSRTTTFSLVTTLTTQRMKSVRVDPFSEPMIQTVMSTIYLRSMRLARLIFSVLESVWYGLMVRKTGATWRVPTYTSLPIWVLKTQWLAALRHRSALWAFLAPGTWGTGIRCQARSRLSREKFSGWACRTSTQSCLLARFSTSTYARDLSSIRSLL